jgi:hypothetical protein
VHRTQHDQDMTAVQQRARKAREPHRPTPRRSSRTQPRAKLQADAPPKDHPAARPRG